MNQRKVPLSNQKSSTKLKRRIIKESTIPVKSVYVDVSNSNISSFSFLKRVSKVLSVNATNTLISDFTNSPFCFTLRQIQIQNSPITKYSNYKLMILIALSPDIEYIDNQKVTKDEKQKAQSLTSLVRPKLIEGFIITSLDPITLCKADQTVAINAMDVDPPKKNMKKNKIKMEQTVEMIEKLNSEINEASNQLGISLVHNIRVGEVLGNKKKRTKNIVIKRRGDTFQKNGKKIEKSSFESEFNKYTQNPDVLVNSSLVIDTPEKREERHRSIKKSVQQRSQNSSRNSSELHFGINDQISIQKQMSEKEEVTITQIYDDVTEPSILKKGDVSVEKIFDIASEIMMSPQKASNFVETQKSDSSENSNSLLNKKSSIPVKLDSPSKKYCDVDPEEKLNQSKFGGYRKEQDSYSYLSEADDYNITPDEYNYYYYSEYSS